MHKSWGNAIEFDEAAERMGVDVMRWMFAKARPEENILFGWHAADEARRELLILWNVYAFFVTYARLAGWTPARGRAAGSRRAPGARSLDPVARRGHGRGGRGAPARRGRRRRDAGAVDVPRRALDLVPAAVAPAVLALGRRRRPLGGVRDAPRGARGDDPDAGTDPAVPGRRDVREPRRRAVDEAAPGQRPPDLLADARISPATGTQRLEAAMDLAQRAVDLARTLRAANGLKTRQPLAHAWLAVPDRGFTLDQELLDLIAVGDQRQGRRAHRRRLGARRAAGQAAAAQDRQAARVGDPGRHGRRPRGRRRVRRRTARSRWPA